MTVTITKRDDLERPLTWDELDANFVNLKTAVEAQESSSGVTFIQIGSGMVQSTVQIKLRESVSVFDAMTAAQISDVQSRAGTLDVSSAIQAAIDYVASLRGGRILFPAGVYNIGTTLDIPYSNIMLVGSRADRTHEGGGAGTLGATTFSWSGAVGGTIVDIYSPEGAANQKQIGCGMTDIYFVANGRAAYGMKVRSQNNGLYERLYFQEMSTAAMYMGTVATLVDARDPQQNVFSQIETKNVVNTGSAIKTQDDEEEDLTEMSDAAGEGGLEGRHG